MPFDANSLRSLGLDPQAAASLGALSGLRGLDEAGFRRTAGPMGSIAQNLMPLLQAVQQAKVAESQAVLNQLLVQAQLTKSLQGTTGRPLNIDQEIVRRSNAGLPVDDLIAARRAMQKPSQPSETTIAVGAAKGDQEAQAVWNKLMEGKAAMGGALAGSRMAAEMPYRLSEFSQEQAIKQQMEASKKKPLPQPVLANYAKMTEGLRNLDSVINEFETGQVTKGDAAKAWLTHGLISNPTLRGYATFYNDVANRRFKSRVTVAEMDRLRKELPPPESYILDPASFVKSLRKARTLAGGALKKEFSYDKSSFDVPDELTQDVGMLTAPKPSIIPGREEAIKKIIEKTGWERTRAEAALDAQ